MTLPRFPYKIGDVVSGRDCQDVPFTGTVTDLIGPYTVQLNGNTFTPISLIDTPSTTNACRYCDGSGFFYSDPDLGPCDCVTEGSDVFG